MKTTQLSIRNVIVLLSVVVAGIAFSGCSKKHGSSNTAAVNLVNACAGTSTGIYTKVNSNYTGPGNMAYCATSGYQSVPAGSADNVNFYLSDGTPLSSGTPTFSANGNYSIFVGGIITGPSFVVVSDDLAAPSSGKAKVRFVNLSSDNFNESFYVGVGTAALDSNIGYTVATPFHEITATTGIQVLIQDPANITYYQQIASQPLAAGKIYTIMLTGTSTATSGGASVLKLTVINNN